MIAREVKHEAMARQTIQRQPPCRRTWEPAAPRLLPDYEKVVQLLADFDAIGTQVAGTSSAGYTDAKDRAEVVAVAAAVRVVKGLDSLGKEDEFEEIVAEHRQARRLVAGGHGPHDASGPAVEN